MPDPLPPGWRPDPQRPGMLRWWNGLGWSDARRAADAAADRAAGVRPVAEDDARRDGGALAAAQRAAAGAPAARAAAALNPLAAPAVVLGVLALTVGLVGVLPIAGLVVSAAGLVRSRRLAQGGERRTGFGRSLAGLILSAVGLVRWIPALVALVESLDLRFS